MYTGACWISSRLWTNVTNDRGFCGASGLDGGDRSLVSVMLAELHTVKARMDTNSSVYGAVSHSGGSMYHGFDATYNPIKYIIHFK